MSTLRDAAKALVESEQALGRRYGDALCIWCDANPAEEAHGAGCEFGALVRALESETREAALCRCGHGEKAHSPDGWCEFDDCLCTYFRPPPPANTENDR